ncbi:MAG: Eco57I restriction-modification methylase domain-containing protein, partial [Christensenellaceae bacterium]|nr:Eco57I restriction-modification methylase domain-containing protein [Christensenellaceae bacterium]
ASFGNKRDELKAKFINIQSDILKERQRLGDSSERVEQLTNWQPFTNDKTDWVDFEWMFGISKFELIIANPPYVHLENISSLEKSRFSKRMPDKNGKVRIVPRYKTHVARGDIYCLFYEQGINLLKDGGFLIYITSNKWMTSTYGELLRNYFIENTNPIYFIDL